MKKATWILGVILGGLAGSCGAVQDVQAPESSAQRDDVTPDDEDEGDDDEVIVSLDQVPEAAKKAALAAVPGFVPSEAEKETEEGSLHYCVHGTADGEFVEVEVTADGRVLEIERGEDEDDED